MRHWHQCQRWTRRAMGCPFRGDVEHEDTPDVSDRIDFTQTPPIPKEVKVRVPAAPPEEALVRVREPRLPVPKQLAAAVSLPIPVPGSAPGDIVDIPPPPPGEEVPGKVTSGNVSITVRSIMRAAEESVGRVPQKASFRAEDFAFLSRSQIAEGSVDVREQNRLSGQARVDAIQTQMAEEAVAEAFAPAQTQQIKILRELVERPPPGIVAIPLLTEAFRLIRRSGLFKSAIPIKPGAVVPADISPRSTPLTVKNEPRIQSAKGVFKGRGVEPAPRSVGGTFFNAAERMRQMTGVSRRMVGDLIGGEGG